MKLQIVGVLVGVALAATACGGGSNLPKSAPAPAHVWTKDSCKEASQSDWLANCQQFSVVPVRSEGSVLTDEGKSVQWPDGLKVTFVSATNQPDTREWGDKDWSHGQGRVIANRVQFTLQLQNIGTVPFKKLITNNNIQVLGGVDRYQMVEDTTSFDGVNNVSRMPTQLAPGSDFTLYVVYSVPTEYRNSIAMTVFSNGMTGGTTETVDYTFTNIEKVIGASVSSSAVPTPKVTPTTSAVPKSTLSDAQVEAGCDKGEISKAECDAAGRPRRDPAAPARTPTAPCVPGLTGDALAACLGDS